MSLPPVRSCSGSGLDVHGGLGEAGDGCRQALHQCLEHVAERVLLVCRVVNPAQHLVHQSPGAGDVEPQRTAVDHQDAHVQQLTAGVLDAPARSVAPNATDDAADGRRRSIRQDGCATAGHAVRHRRHDRDCLIHHVHVSLVPSRGSAPGYRNQMTVPIDGRCCLCFTVNPYEMQA